MEIEPLHLAKAPIVEAVIDLDCDLGPQFDVQSVLTAATDAFGNEYPKMEKQWVHEIQVKYNENETVQSGLPTLNALRFWSLDGKQLVQVRRQGFSFNRLTPYTNLDDYIPHVKGLWDTFRSFVPVRSVLQLSLRYINHIDPGIEPGSLWELSDYFTIARSNAWNDSVKINSFLINYAGRSDLHHAGFQVVLSSSAASGAILDLAVYQELGIEPENWDAIIEAVKTLRLFKNELFKEAITEKCLQMYQ
ncbi:MAG: TIGR04255 family protein [Fimbriimonadaceae bacterium]|nr:TIGR04255 family protein [Fimbriimonadaceae bacterium]